MHDSNNRYIPELPMKWYKFLIYFYLWYLMVSAVISIFQYVASDLFGSLSMAIIDSAGIPELNAVFAVVCVAEIGIVILLFKTWQALSNSRRIGPKLFYLYILLNTVINVGSRIAVVALVSAKKPVPVSGWLPYVIIQIIVSVVFYICNKVYFDNRKDYFDFD